MHESYVSIYIEWRIGSSRNNKLIWIIWVEKEEEKEKEGNDDLQKQNRANHTFQVGLPELGPLCRP